MVKLDQLVRKDSRVERSYRRSWWRAVRAPLAHIVGARISNPKDSRRSIHRTLALVRSYQSRLKFVIQNKNLVVFSRSGSSGPPADASLTSIETSLFLPLFERLGPEIGRFWMREVDPAVVSLRPNLRLKCLARFVLYE